jgi:tripartite-type tricarboxylate transporter receptor subunit TctC
MGGWLSQRLGQQVIVENKPGAATNIATQAVIASPADGYTLLWDGICNVINASVYANLPFNFLRDIAPVAATVVFPLVIEVHLPSRSKQSPTSLRSPKPIRAR